MVRIELDEVVELLVRDEEGVFGAAGGDPRE